MNQPLKPSLSLLAGLVFVILWASASSATKIGLGVAQPFVLAIIRFAVASSIMLIIAHIVMRQRLPAEGRIWTQLTIYGLLNVGLYLGLYVIAMREVSAGLGALFIAINPVLITLISTVWRRQPLRPVIIVSFILCIAGMLLAADPLLKDSYATTSGLVILFLSNVSYSVSAIYFREKDWTGLRIMTINGWQTLLGGAFLLPLMLLFYDGSANTFGPDFWLATLWLAIPASMIAVMLWLLLLRDNPTKASFWLFLCPIAGFAIAAILMGEPLSWHTFAGSLLVITGLYLVQRIR